MAHEKHARRALYWGLLLPMTLLILGLKLLRVTSRSDFAAWWTPLELMRSDLLLVGVLWIVVPVIFHVLRTRTNDAVAIGLIQVVALPWAALEIIAHHFFMVTGSTFDLHLLFFSLGRFAELHAVIASEVPLQAWAFLAFTLCLILASPWLLRNYLDRNHPDDLEEPRWADRPIWVVGLSSLLLVGALLPAAGEEYVSFGRATVINQALSLQGTGSEPALHVHRESLKQLAIVPRETEEARERPRNLVIVILESTRARSMTVHNPELPTTPFLADLADHSLVADRAYSVVPHTSKALVAILCGLEPRLRMPITEAQPGGLPVRCLASLLGDEGYRSVFLQSATERFEDRPGLVENMGYDDFIPLERMDRYGFEEANYFGLEDMVMLPPSEEWLRSLADDEPFFATYLTLTPHHDYLAPERFGRFEFHEDDEINRYKNTIYYVDQFSRHLLEQFQELGLYEDTLFVFVGDHGEGFNEHGRTQHDNVIWEEGVHIPLFIYDPQRREGERLSAPISQIDIAPTVLKEMGFSTEGPEYPGMHLRESDADRAVFSHCWYEQRCMARIGQRFKYIDHFGRRRPEVFDLLEDPLETQNLLGQQTNDERLWRAELHGWRNAVNDLYRREQADYVAEALLDELPESATPLDFDLGEFARFRGYELDAAQGRRGHRFTVTYYFEVISDIPDGWRLFVHGESDGRMVNLDHIPVQGLHPLDEWEPGTLIANRHTFRIPRDWSPGTFEILLGIYHPDDGRVPLFGDVDTDGDRRARVVTFPFR